MAERLRDLAEPELATRLRRCAQSVTFYLPEGSLFMLLAFDPDDASTGQYIANAERAGVVAAMRACADRLERREDEPRVGWP